MKTIPTPEELRSKIEKEHWRQGLGATDEEILMIIRADRAAIVAWAETQYAHPLGPSTDYVRGSISGRKQTLDDIIAALKKEK